MSETDQNAYLSNDSPVSDLNWDQLDKGKFFLYTFGGSIVARSIVYPPQLIKTRLQSTDMYRGMWHAAFWKGFRVQLLSVLPAQIAYLSMFEFVRANFPTVSNDPTAQIWARNFVAGGTATLASTLLTIPCEIISQRMMIQGTPTKSTLIKPVPVEGQPQYRYSGFLSALQDIKKKEGIRGLYRGYAATLMLYAPSSALFWSSYYSLKNKLGRIPLPSRMVQYRDEIVMFPATIGASLITSLCTFPVDIVKTRLQVLPESQNKRMYQVFTDIIKKNGFAGLLRGLQARIISNLIFSMCMTPMYDSMKKLSKL